MEAIWNLWIPASLCEGYIFLLYAESVNLFPYVSSKHLSCCDPTIYLLIYSTMSFILPCLAQCFYLNEYNFESFQWLQGGCYDWACNFCNISSNIKTLLERWVQSVNCSLTKNKVWHHQLWFSLCTFIVTPFTCCNLSYMRGRCYINDLCIDKCDASCLYFFYRLFTP